MTNPAPSASPANPANPVDRPDPLDRLALSARLSLVYLVLNPGLGWMQRAPVQIAAALALVIPGAWQNRLLWLGLAGWMALRLVMAWPHSDNHDYLIAYWCLALGIALSLPGRSEALARSARLLIGLCFGFAVLWKGILSPDFVNGNFFRMAFLFDARFADLAQFAGGITPSMVDHNDHFLATGQGSLVEPAALTRLAWFSTVWTLASESAIALLFLWPQASGIISHLTRCRDVVLIAFLATTYAVAPVAGFGWLLACMGLAQTTPDARMTRIAYVLAFFLIEIYRSVPWLDALAGV